MRGMDAGINASLLENIYNALNEIPFGNGKKVLQNTTLTFKSNYENMCKTFHMYNFSCVKIVSRAG